MSPRKLSRETLEKLQGLSRDALQGPKQEFQDDFGITSATHFVQPSSLLRFITAYIAGVGSLESEFYTQHRFGLSKSSSSRFEDWQAPMSGKLSMLITALVSCAATLAFTDWDESLQQLSVGATFPLGLHSWGEGWFSHRDEHVWFLDEHTRSILEKCVGKSGVHSNRLQEIPQSWVASELDGTAAVRTHAMDMSLTSLDGRFLNLRHGLIGFEGSTCTTLQSFNAFQDSNKMFGSSLVADLHRRPANEVKPCDAVTDISVRSLCSRQGDTIWIRSEMCLTPAVRQIDMVRIAKAYLI